MTDRHLVAISFVNQRHATMLRPGDDWPELGGAYAGAIQGDSKHFYHLILCTDPRGDLAPLAWGGYGQHEANTQSSWDGCTNTQALLRSPHSHPAAERITALNIDGFTDYYLPSQRELSLLWATVPHLLKKEWYWSSMQSGRNSAWCQNFDQGGQYFESKHAELRTIAVRRILV